MAAIIVDVDRKIDYLTRSEWYFRTLRGKDCECEYIKVSKFWYLFIVNLVKITKSSTFGYNIRVSLQDNHDKVIHFESFAISRVFYISFELNFVLMELDWPMDGHRISNVA